MFKSGFPKSIFALNLALLSIATGAFAATKQTASTPKNSNSAHVAGEIPANDKVPLMTDAEYEKLIADSKKDSANRAVAHADIDRIDYRLQIADDLKSIISDIQGGAHWSNHQAEAVVQPGVKNSAQLAKVIDGLEKNYANLSPGAKFVAAQMIALKPYRGILFRLRPLAESQHTPFVHGMIISFLRGLNAGVNNLYPTDQWKAGFDYLARPYPNMGPTITNEQQLNQFVVAQVLPTQINLLGSINALPAGFYVDNRIYTGKDNFVSGGEEDRFQHIGAIELQTYVAALSFNISSIYSALAYDWSDLFKATQSFWTVYGFNTALARPDNMTAEQRTHEIQKNTKLFTLLPGGENLTHRSYFWFNNGLKFSLAAWNRVKGANLQKSEPDAGTPPYLNPQNFAGYTRAINTTFKNIDELNKGSGIASAVANGEVVDVNFKAFFDNPPQDLKVFLPNHFKPGEHFIVDGKDGNNTGQSFRNYERGNPDGWDTGKFTPYFPGVKTNEDVKRVARVVSQSWGGGILGFPLATVLY